MGATGPRRVTRGGPLRWLPCSYPKARFARIAQESRRVKSVRDRGVGGSNPLAPTIFSLSFESGRREVFRPPRGSRRDSARILSPRPSSHSRSNLAGVRSSGHRAARAATRLESSRPDQIFKKKTSVFYVDPPF